jgi:hypothetical protein
VVAGQHVPVVGLEPDAAPGVGLALRHRLAGVAIQLDAVGEQAGLAPGDLHVADRDEQVGGAADLLELVGHYGGFLAARADRHAARLRPGRAGGEPHGGPRREQGREQGHPGAALRPLGPGIERTGGRDGDMRPHASSGLRP